MTRRESPARDKTELFAEELTRIAMKVLSKMSKKERWERLRKLDALLRQRSKKETKKIAND